MKLTLKDFAKIFGEDIKSMSSNFRKRFHCYDFRYRILYEKEFRNVILESIKQLDLNKFSISGKEKLKIWEKGWGENLNNFIKNNHNLIELKPKFYKNHILKLFDNYIEIVNPDFEYNLSDVMTLFLFEKYFKNFNNIYEFGCGTGYNLVSLRKCFPEKNLYGFDWSKSSIKLINEINKYYNFNINSKVFDMFNPDYIVDIEKSSLVFTFGAMEQLGSNYKEFLKFLLNKKPSLCVQIEPFYELYDENNLLDYLAMKYHNKKNQLIGYLTELKRLDSKGIIKILRIKRGGIGSLFSVGWNVVIWRIN